MDGKNKSADAEITFLKAQNAKLIATVRQQEDEIADLRMANQDLKYQLTQKHEVKK
jgi:hypothetical protein